MNWTQINVLESRKCIERLLKCRQCYAKSHIEVAHFAGLAQSSSQSCFIEQT